MSAIGKKDGGVLRLDDVLGGPDVERLGEFNLDDLA